MIGLYNVDDPVQTVLKIFNIVAVDAPIAQITRLINTYQSVISCTRKKDERLSIFASRFRGLASKHLRYCGASTSSQTGQILAITLLNNTRLGEIVLTNAKVKLIVLAQDRAKNAEDENDRNTIPLSNLKHALMYAEEFKEKCEEDLMEDVDSEEKLKDAFIDKVRNGSDQIFKILESARNAAQKQPSEEVTLEEMLKDKSVVIKLHLDDAMSVLRNIAHDSQSQPSFTAAEVHSMVAAQVITYLSNHGRGVSLANSPPLGTNGDRRNNGNGNGNGNSKKRKKHGQGQGDGNSANNRDSRGSRPEKRRKRLNELITDADNHCIDCGSKTHKRDDEEFKSISWGTKKIREARKRDNQGDGQSGFREGSSR